MSLFRLETVFGRKGSSRIGKLEGKARAGSVLGDAPNDWFGPLLNLGEKENQVGYASCATEVREGDKTYAVYKYDVFRDMREMAFYPDHVSERTLFSAPNNVRRPRHSYASQASNSVSTVIMLVT